MAIQKRTATTGLATLTSPNGTARGGTPMSMELCAMGTLVAECSCTIVTGSVVATFTPQGTTDSTTWYDLRNLAGSSQVALTASGREALCIPPNAAAYTMFRVKAVLSGASTAGGDTTTVTYRYVQPGGVEQVR